MVKKYEVRNCPAFNIDAEDWNCMHPDTDSLVCYKCTDCIIKQVVEKCREPEQVYRSYEKPLTQTQCNTLFGRMTLGNEILQLFTIEEVE